MDKERYYFGFRYDCVLGVRIANRCDSTGITLNELVERAFSFAANLHDKRKLLFYTDSGFRIRPLFAGKITAMLIHSAAQREKVRNFAFSYRRSMAEILRISLEVYLDFLDKIDGKIDVIKHYYRHPQAVIVQTLITLYPSRPLKLPQNTYYSDS